MERGWKIGICIPQESWITCPWKCPFPGLGFPSLALFFPSRKIFLNFPLLSCVPSLEFCRPPGHGENLFPFPIFPSGKIRISLALPLLSTKPTPKPPSCSCRSEFPGKSLEAKASVSRDPGTSRSAGNPRLEGGRARSCPRELLEPGHKNPGSEAGEATGCDRVGEETRENPIPSTNQP